MEILKKNLKAIVIFLCLMSLMAYVTFVITKKDDDSNSVAATTLTTDNPNNYTDLSGCNVSLDEFSGQIRVVNSWASWSPFSKRELRDLNTAAAQFSSEEVVFIAINRNESRDRAQGFLNTLDPLPNLKIVLDGDDTFYDRIDGYAMPETIFFDRRGDLVFQARGDLTYDEIITHTKAALAAE